MGYFDALTSSSFKTTKDGHRLFFPWGTIGRGYIIPTEEEYERLRRKVKIYLIISLPMIGILVNRLSIIGDFVLMIVLTLPYILWANKRCLQLKPSNEKYTFKQSFGTQAREYNAVTLWLLEICSLAFVAAGIFILFKDTPNWLIALASIIFFGLGAIVFAKMILTRNQQQD